LGIEPLLNTLILHFVNIRAPHKNKQLSHVYLPSCVKSGKFNSTLTFLNSKVLKPFFIRFVICYVTNGRY